MAGRVKKISVEEAKGLIQKPYVFLLDVREPKEYEEGHLPGATLIPLSELPDRISELKDKKEIIAYCRSGVRSLAAANLIAHDLDINTYSMEGGIRAWNDIISTGRLEDMEKLTEGLKEPYEFISLAYSLEDGAEKFYQKISKDPSFSEFKDVFEMLANVEGMHKEKISLLAKDTKIDERFKDLMEGGVSISEAFEEILSVKRDIKSLLEFCMQMEVNSLDLYMRILRLVEEKTRDVFNHIIADEKRHLKQLGEKLSEL